MPKSSKAADNHRPNTLGLREKDLGRLLNRMDGGRKDQQAGRVYSRWQFQQTAIPVLIQHPGGTEIEVRMACRNLSKGGIGLLHRGYLHLNTRCVLTLAHPLKGAMRIAGKVVRCLHVDGMVHEIGIAFDESIDIRSFMRPDPMQEILAIERVDPHALVGTVLLVDDSAMDARLVKHFLRETQLRVRHTTTVAEAEKLVRGGVGLILCDIHLGEENGGDLVRRIQESAQAAPPLILTSADTSRSTQELVRSPVVTGFLAKPYTQDVLLRTVAEFLRESPEASGGALGELKADRALVAALLPELGLSAGRLESALEEGEHTLVLAILMQIKGVAPVLGLADISMLAETLAHQLAVSMDLNGVRARVGELVRIAREAAAAA